MTDWYPWVVTAHVIGAFGFVMAHGVSAIVAFRLPRAASAVESLLDERRTGERKEGAYSAASTVALKAGAALTIAASGPVMSATGFVPNVEQSAESLVGLRILFAGLPCAGFLLGAWVFRRFSLSDPPPPSGSGPAPRGSR